MSTDNWSNAQNYLLWPTPATSKFTTCAIYTVYTDTIARGENIHTGVTTTPIPTHTLAACYSTSRPTVLCALQANELNEDLPSHTTSFLSLVLFVYGTTQWRHWTLVTIRAVRRLKISLTIKSFVTVSDQSLKDTQIYRRHSCSYLSARELHRYGAKRLQLNADNTALRADVHGSVLRHSCASYYY